MSRSLSPFGTEPIDHYRRGKGYADQERWDDAIREFRSEVKAHPDNTDAHYELGIACFKKGQIADSIQPFQAALRIDADHVKAHHNLALAYQLGKRWEEAIREAEAVLRIDPDFEKAHYTYYILGTAYAKKGQLENAVAALEAAVGLGCSQARGLLDNVSRRVSSDPPSRSPRPQAPQRDPRGLTCADGAASRPEWLDDHFDVIKTLSGGMGIVHLCLDKEEGTPIALKTFRSELLSDRSARDRFLREGTTWVRLGSHPHLVRCHQVFSHENSPQVYLELDWIAHAKGKCDASLRAWLQPGKALSLAQALLFGLHIARGMKQASTAVPGLVHRDLKPENVLVGRDGLARVTDFGLAKTLSLPGITDSTLLEDGSDLHRTRLTQGGVGTPLYMAPEQWTDQVVLDARADIYAFGCILYEMATGRPAVSASTLHDLQIAHQLGHLNPFPPHWPEVFSLLLERCLATRREDRYPDWGAVEHSVEEAYRAATGKTAPPELVGQPATRAERLLEGWSYYAVGHSYRELGKFNRALTHFELVEHVGRQERDHRLEAAGLHGIGAIRADLGYPRDAISYYQSAIACFEGPNPDLAHTHASLANAYRDLGETKKAMDHYERALEHSRESTNRHLEGSILLSYGNAHRRVGRIAKAIELYERGLSLARSEGARATELTAVGNLGIAHRNLGDPEAAISFQEQALELAREIGDLAKEGAALNNLGLAHGDLGHSGRAIDLFEQALTVACRTGAKRFEATVQMNLANSLRSLGQTETAIDLATTALASADETGDILRVAQCNLSLAMSMLKEGRFDKAEEHAQVAARVFEQYGRTQFALAATQLIEQIRGSSPASDHYQQAVRNLDQGRWNAAVREADAALRIDPAFFAALYCRGVALSNLGRLEAATRSFRQALDVNPGSVDTHTSLGIVYMKQGRWGDATRELQAALQIDPENAHAHYNLGGICSLQDRWADAIRHYQAVLRMNPTDADAHYNLGVAYQSMGRWSDAIEAFEAAAALGSRDAQGLLGEMGR